jgi:23S rRNA pseudouridine1911/1915/1917 synthase
MRQPGDRSLAARLQALHPGASRRSIKQWLETGRVRVNGRVIRRGDHRLGDHDRVDLGPPAPPPLPAGLRLIHVDPALVVVDKPPGLLTIATEHERERTAYRALQAWAQAQGGRIFVVHRLDRETSGLVVFARSVAAKRTLQAQFESRSVERTYVARVEGLVAAERGTLTGHVVEDRALRVRVARGRRGKDAITHYRVLARGRDTTLLELRLETGRRGQIRAQVAALGHPIVGDRAFGSRRDPLRRLCLHATRLGFVHPAGGHVVFDSAPPAAFGRG